MTRQLEVIIPKAHTVHSRTSDVDGISIGHFSPMIIPSDANDLNTFSMNFGDNFLSEDP